MPVARSGTGGWEVEGEGSCPHMKTDAVGVCSPAGKVMNSDQLICYFERCRQRFIRLSEGVLFAEVLSALPQVDLKDMNTRYFVDDCRGKNNICLQIFFIAIGCLYANLRWCCYK